MVVNVTKPVTQSQESVLSTNRVLRNTYALLAATLLFSAVMAAVSMAIAPPPMMSMVSFFGAIALLWFVLPRFQNSATGVGIVFLFTGLLGFSLGPMLNAYVSLPNGGTVVATAMGGTGTIFLALSAYVLTTKKTFNFMGGMLFVGMMVVLGAIIINIFAQMPALSLAISSVMILLMSGFILYDTGRIVSGEETNYINATVQLFMNIFMMFTHMLQLLGIMGDD